MTKTRIKPPTGDRTSVAGEVMDPHPAYGGMVRYFQIVEEAMQTCISIANLNLTEDPKLAVGAALAAGRLAQVGHAMTLNEERAEREREDHDDKHLRLAGRTSSPHARVRQARAERRLIRREEQEIERINTPRW